MYVYNSKVTKRKKKYQGNEHRYHLILHSYHENRFHFDYIQKGERVNAYFNGLSSIPQPTLPSIQWNGKVRI